MLDSVERDERNESPFEDPTIDRMLDVVESTLFHIAKMPNLSRAQAIYIKSKFQKPLGVLNTRFSLASNSSKYVDKRRR